MLEDRQVFECMHCDDTPCEKLVFSNQTTQGSDKSCGSLFVPQENKFNLGGRKHECSYFPMRNHTSGSPNKKDNKRRFTVYFQTEIYDNRFRFYQPSQVETSEIEITSVDWYNLLNTTTSKFVELQKGITVENFFEGSSSGIWFLPSEVNHCFFEAYKQYKVGVNETQVQPSMQCSKLENKTSVIENNSPHSVTVKPVYMTAYLSTNGTGHDELKFNFILQFKQPEIKSGEVKDIRKMRFTTFEGKWFTFLIHSENPIIANELALILETDKIRVIIGSSEEVERGFKESESLLISRYNAKEKIVMDNLNIIVMFNDTNIHSMKTAVYKNNGMTFSVEPKKSKGPWDLRKLWYKVFTENFEEELNLIKTIQSKRDENEQEQRVEDCNRRTLDAFKKAERVKMLEYHLDNVISERAGLFIALNVVIVICVICVLLYVSECRKRNSRINSV